jgi:mannose-6-phosphate isomerase-like protein (cupin superfamily)
MIDRMSEQAVRRVDKPWGYELIWAVTDRYVGKVLHIERGHKLSLQYHRRKVETFLLSTGTMTLLFEDEAGVMREKVMRTGDVHHVPAGKKHRMIALEDCDVFEVSTPELDDVVRLDDSYGRVDG